MTIFQWQRPLGYNELTMKGRDGLGGIDDVRKGEALNFTLIEAAELVNVSVALLRREAKNGRVRSVTIGHRTLIPRAEVMRLVGLDRDETERGGQSDLSSGS